MAYNTNVFQDNTLIRTDLPRLRENASTVASAFGSDHAPLTTSDDTAGNHTTIKFINRTAHPTDSKDSFYVLNDNGVKRLYARFGSVSGTEPVELVASQGTSTPTGTGVQIANNPGTLGDAISYIDTVDGTRKYWGQAVADPSSLRTSGLTVTLPSNYQHLITAYAYFSSATSVDITSNSNFSGVIIEAQTGATFNFLSRLSTSSSSTVPINWYIEVINVST